MRTFTKTIAAGDSAEIREKGDFFKIRSTTGALAVSSGDNRVRLDTVGTGQGFRGIPFNSLILENNGASAVTVSFAISQGNGGELIDAIQIASDAEIAETPCQSTGGVTRSGVQILSVPTFPTTYTTDPLPAGTRSIVVRASQDNTDPIFVGTYPLWPGDQLPLNLGEGATFTYWSLAASQNIYALSLID